MFQENSIETCILSRVKQITSPGWIHETSARTWCTGKTQRDRVEREVGGGIRMGNTCKPMAVSFQCMTKPTTIKKKKKKECLPYPFKAFYGRHHVPLGHSFRACAISLSLTSFSLASLTAGSSFLPSNTPVFTAFTWPVAALKPHGDNGSCLFLCRCHTCCQISPEAKLLSLLH